jgi:hypothetical protein
MIVTVKSLFDWWCDFAPSERHCCPDLVLSPSKFALLRDGRLMLCSSFDFDAKERPDVVVVLPLVVDICEDASVSKTTFVLLLGEDCWCRHNTAVVVVGRAGRRKQPTEDTPFSLDRIRMLLAIVVVR